MYKKAQTTNAVSDWNNFKSFRKTVQKKIRAAYWSYTNRMLNDPEDRQNKKFWRYIKAKRQDNTSGVSPLTHNNKAVTDSLGKANILNSQFKSVFTTENLDNLPCMGESPFPDVPNIQVSTEGVCKLLKDINITKATGPDLVPARIMKEMAEELPPLL